MSNSEELQTIIKAIIVSQQAVIGPIALQTANKVSGLEVSLDLKNIEIKEDGQKVLERLVSQYESLFGRASVEVCKDAIRPIIAKSKGINLPQILL